MEKYDLEFDPMMPGVFRTVRFNMLASGSHNQMAAKFRLFGTPIALSDKMPPREADAHWTHYQRALFHLTGPLSGRSRQSG